MVSDDCVYSRVEQIWLDSVKEQRVPRRMDQLATSFGLQFTAPRKLDMKLAAIWETAFLSVRHKASCAPDKDKTQLLLEDQQMGYEVPAKMR